VENLLIIAVMLLILDSAKNKSLILLIAFFSVIALTVDYLVKDIAIFYSINAVLAMSVSYLSASLRESDSRRVYAILMFMQALICISLVAEWSDNVNATLEHIQAYFNNGLQYVIILLGMVDSGRFFLPSVCDSDNISHPSCNHRGGNSGKDN